MVVMGAFLQVIVLAPQRKRRCDIWIGFVLTRSRSDYTVITGWALAIALLMVNRAARMASAELDEPLSCGVDIHYKLSLPVHVSCAGAQTQIVPPRAMSGLNVAAVGCAAAMTQTEIVVVILPVTKLYSRAMLDIETTCQRIHSGILPRPACLARRGYGWECRRLSFHQCLR